MIPDELGFLNHADDLVTLAEEQERNWLDYKIVDILAFCLPARTMKVNLPHFRGALIWSDLRQRIFASPDQRIKSDDNLRLRSGFRVDALVRLVLCITIVVLLIAPTWILFILSERNIMKIIVIMIFTLLFSTAISYFSKARRNEVSFHYILPHQAPTNTSGS